jgi:hypothetical protein
MEIKRGTDKEERTDKESFAFSVGHGSLVENPVIVGWHNSIECILDSGCGRHLTGSPDLLGEDANKAGTTLVLPDNTRARSPRKGNIEMMTNVNHEARHIVVEDAEYVPGFKRNSLSNVSLEKKGVRHKYVGDKRYLVRKLERSWLKSNLKATCW